MPYKNKLKRKAKKKEYYQRNKKTILEKCKLYGSHPKVKARRKKNSKLWRENNQEKIKEYRIKNKERNSLRQKKYRQKPEVKKRDQLKRKKYYQKPEVKARRKAYTKEYRSRKGIKERIKKNTQIYNYKNREKISQRTKKYKETYNKNNKKKINYYYKQKRRTNQNYRIGHNLRCLFRIALKNYSTTGKIMSSEKYGIDYKAIIKHLKPFPKDISKYEVDHIIPLSLFDHNDPEQIKKAWAPENHQWLTKEINMWKGNRLIKPLTDEQKEKLQKQLKK